MWLSVNSKGATQRGRGNQIASGGTWRLRHVVERVLQIDADSHGEDAVCHPE
jgi:hypothetical protein